MTRANLGFIEDGVLLSCEDNQAKKLTYYFIVTDLKTEGVEMKKNKSYLKTTPTIDCDHWTIREKADELTERQKEIKEKAKSLFTL